MDEQTPTVSLVSCMKFVKRGVAKAHPDKIELTQQELEKIIKKTAKELSLTDVVENDSDDEGAALPDPPANPSDEFNFDKYDDEEDSNPIGLGTVATATNLGDLGEHVNIQTEGPDSDEEDDIIKESDNLLIVGHVESDASILEVYVYNKEEGSFYVHHDIILPWFPLCIEWLSHDPLIVPNVGNLCALGGMDPVIQVWDLDMENSLEPVFKLGKKPNKKRKIKRVGHKDAVLDLSWNKNFSHVLASGSADCTVLLWDLDEFIPHTKLDYFEDKVQAVLFHPLEAQTLLVGGCDGKARVTDCTSPDAHRAWDAEGEIERVAWDTHHPYCFAMSNNLGKIYYVDCRQSEPMWSLQVHEKEVTGLILSDKYPGLMITSSMDGYLKTWDIINEPSLVSSREMKVGQVLCSAVCPESFASVAIGGDNKQNYIEMVELNNIDEFKNRFGSNKPESSDTQELMET